MVKKYRWGEGKGAYIQSLGKHGQSAFTVFGSAPGAWAPLGWENALPLELTVFQERQTGQITKLWDRLEDGKCTIFVKKRDAGYDFYIGYSGSH